jgi:hypothetical protein
MLSHIEAHSGAGDLVIDYHSLESAIGGHPDEVKKLRNALIGKMVRGDVDAERIWLTSTNPNAERMFPHHEVVVIDPGREHALQFVPPGGEVLTDAWYAAMEHVETPATRREW